MSLWKIVKKLKKFSTDPKIIRLLLQDHYGKMNLPKDPELIPFIHGLIDCGIVLSEKEVRAFSGHILWSVKALQEKTNERTCELPEVL